MRSLDSYLTEYADSHRHPQNIVIHNICVPLIMWSLLGFLHSYTLFRLDFHLSYVLIVLSMVYYAMFLQPAMLLSMGVLTFIMLASYQVIPELRVVTLVVFALAWIGQFYGHKQEGKKPSFFKDLLFLLIGPVWVLRKAVPRLRIIARAAFFTDYF